MMTETCEDTPGLEDGCEAYFDGLVCWPSTISGHQARVDCLEIEAFAQALKFMSNSNEISSKICNCHNPSPSPKSKVQS